MSSSAKAPAVEFHGITKRFPGVVALREVSFAVTAGSCHALIGENGAGKSTLGRILAGIDKADAGRITLGGRAVRFANPRHAADAGIALVHQELAFCENLTVGENLRLGDLPRCGPFLRRRVLRQGARRALQAIELDVSPDAVLGDLTVGQQQMVQIAAAVSRGARILVFDEPTSSLSRVESERFFALLRRLRARGVTCIYISHRLEEVFALCDRVTVLRDGTHVGTRSIPDVQHGQLVELMIGRRLDSYFPRHVHGSPGREVLRVEDLSSPPRFAGVSFSLRAGEVLGLAGLVGAGRSEVAHAIFGLDPRARGSVWLGGRPLPLRNTAQAMRHGLGLVPEDRQRHGLILSLTVKDNMTLPSLGRLSRLGFVREQTEAVVCRSYFRRLDIRATGIRALTASLSGGNQQKVVLAKWLATRCRVLLIDEPTRGIDVGAKAEIHGLIDELAAGGTAILLISSELPEIVNLSTRVLVFRAGRVVREISRAEADPDTILRLMAGLG